MARNDYKKEEIQKRYKMQKTMPKEAPENCTNICEKNRPRGKQKKEI